MATNYSYLSQGEIKAIAAELIESLTFGPDTDPIFGILPVTQTRNQNLVWEQRDIEGGLMQVRDLDAPFPTVPKVGMKAWNTKPWYYGEQYPITEAQLTNQRKPGTFGDPIEEAELINEGIRYLTNRAVRRMEQVGWSVLTTGTFSVTDVMGNTVAGETFNLRTTTFSSWSNHATATPVTDLQGLFTFGRGFGASFGAAAQVWMNQKTFNDLTQNTNANDFGGIRAANGATVHFVGQTVVNSLLASFNCPQIVVFDGTYRTNNGENSAVSVWIPDNTLIVVGNRPKGETIGEVRQTWNATARDTGFFIGTSIDDDPPYLPRIFSACNFGPVIYYPNSILRISC